MRNVVLELAMMNDLLWGGFIFDLQELSFPQHMSLPSPHILQARWCSFGMTFI